LYIHERKINLKENFHTYIHICLCFLHFEIWKETLHILCASLNYQIREEILNKILCISWKRHGIRIILNSILKITNWRPCEIHFLYHTKKKNDGTVNFEYEWKKISHDFVVRVIPFSGRKASDSSIFSICLLDERRALFEHLRTRKRYRQIS